MRARMESIKAVTITGSIIGFGVLGCWAEEKGGEVGESVW